MKRCRVCRELKPFEAFYANKGGRDNLRPECKACTSERRKRWYQENREAEIARVRRWQEANSDRREAYYDDYTLSGRRAASSRSHLKRAFGLSIEEFQLLVERQGGMCAICRRREAVHVDHDHATGRIRAILCFNCNAGVGHFLDDPELLLRAAMYVRRHRAS